jgi:hypothetical protein
MRRQDIERAVELIDLEPLSLGQPGDIRQPTLGPGSRSLGRFGRSSMYEGQKPGHLGGG